MKKLNKISLLLITVLALSVIVTAFTFKKATKKNVKNGFAVVELFTSEGCSSCPPADDLIAKIQRENTDKPIYILAYHVDYWNRLGWKDVFSSPDYSARQYQYAKWLHLDGVYTPQAIVNGKTEMIGSEAGKLNNAIKNSMQNSAVGNLYFKTVKLIDNEAEIQFETSVMPENEMLVLAIVQKTATINVKSGENGGRTLSHVQIVRKLVSRNLNGKQSGTATITLPGNLAPQNLELFGFIQNTNTGVITAGTHSALNGAGVDEKSAASR